MSMTLFDGKMSDGKIQESKVKIPEIKRKKKIAQGEYTRHIGPSPSLLRPIVAVASFTQRPEFYSWCPMLFALC